MNPLIEDVISRFVHRFVARYYREITAAAAILTVLSIWVMVTQWNINSDFKALLPQTSEAAEAMTEVGERVGSGSALFVVIDSPDMEANKDFAEDFAAELRKLDPVSLAHFHNPKDFFEKHQLLYLKSNDLVTIRERIREKIRDEKKEANPLFASLDSDEEQEGDAFIKTDDIRAKYDGLAQDNYREYLTAADKHSLTMVLRFNESSTDLAATNRLISQIRQIGQGLDPDTYNKELDIEYGGGLINRQKDYESITGDLRTSAVFTLLGLLLVIGLYFRRKRATALVMIPLVMGVCWTLALSFILFGELTTISAFIFAILLGLGIDYSIHLLSGYDHARIEGKDPEAALIHCYKGVGSATVIGALTTFMTFVVLSFAQFRGLSQFGKVASIGVLYTLLAMIVVLPAMILTFHHYFPREAPTLQGGIGVGALVADGRRKIYVPVAIILILSFTGLSITQYPHLSFEEDFRQLGHIEWPWQRTTDEYQKLQNARTDAREDADDLAEHVSTTTRELRQTINPETYEHRRRFETTEEKFESALKGQHSSTPTVLLFDKAENAATVYEAMQKKLQNGGLDTINSVASIHGFVPGSIEEQKSRLAEIREIQEMLNEEDLSGLDDDARQRLEKFRKKLKVEEPVTAGELPEWTKSLFKEAGEGAHAAEDGEPFAYRYLVYVNEGIDQMRGAKAREFLKQIQDVRQETGIDFRIGSQSYIYVQMLDEIKNDGAKMISIALALVFLLLSAAFRSPIRGLVALLPLILGAAWMFGMLAFLGIDLDFFNVVIIPVVIGIGVDAGVHFYRRYLERGEGSGPEVLRLVGSAVAMASITSMVGFGGLAITHHGGLSSIGHLAIVGIGTTLVATFLTMPVVFWLGETFRIDWLLPREQDRN
jgi:hypothetical protein